MSEQIQNKILLKRGQSAPGTILETAEPGYDSKNKRLYIGNGVGQAATSFNPNSLTGASISGNKLTFTKENSNNVVITLPVDEKFGTRIKKVWENPSPAIEFDAQTIDLQFSAGDLAQVFFAGGTDSNARYSLTVECGTKGSVLGKHGNYLTQRTAAVQENGVEISAGNRMLTYGEWSTTDKVLIPVSVYKITGLTDITTVPDLHAICGTFLCGEVVAGQ